MVNLYVLVTVFVLIIGAMIRSDQLRQKNRQRRFQQEIYDRYRTHKK